MKKKIIVLKMCILLLFSCNSRVKKKESESKVLFDIIFANGFNSDEIVLEVNKNEIIKSILVSNKSDGVTSLSYKVVKSGNKIVLINSENAKKYVIDDNQKIVISVLYKEKWYNFHPNRDLGRYILIELNDSIIYNQQKDRPFFD
ncbi:hypothetical protein [Sinomicrobium sp. M5D2P17]